MKRNNGKILAGKTVFITGSQKNAGKTTFLKYALKSLRVSNTPAFLTIGIDGEHEDSVFGNPKPQIYSEEGDLFITSESMINRSDGVFEIREVFPFKTVLGKLVLLKTLRGGFVELVGPEDNKQLSNIIKYIRKNENYKTILIDGSVNRITQIVSGVDADFVFVAKISPRNIKSGVEKIKKLSLMEKIPLYGGNENSNDIYFHKGALTETSIQKIPKNIKTIVIEDFTKIFLPLNRLKSLQKRRRLFFKDIFNLIFIVVNLMDIEKKEFVETLADKDIFDKIVFNPYEAER